MKQTTRRIRPVFTAGEEGTVAMIFALSLFAMMVVIGFTMDFSRLYSAKNKSQSVLDGAVLSAVVAIEKAIADGTNPSDAKKIGEKVAREYLGEFLSFENSLTLKVNVNDNDISAVGSLKAAIEPSLSTILGYETLDFAVTSDAKYGLTYGIGYIDLHILVDTSHSMGLGATTADQQKLINVKGCAFACHNEIDSLRRNHGVVFRIDVVRDAVDSIINLMENKGYTQENDHLRVYLHEFGDSVIRSGPFSNKKAALDEVEQIDIKYGDQYTNYSGNLRDLAKRLPASGSGATPYDRKVMVAFLTDGLATSGETFFPMLGYSLRGLNPDWCEGIKNKDAELFTFNVEYVDNLHGIAGGMCPSAHPYCALSTVLKPHIEDNMKQCATSEEHSFAAETPQELRKAVEEFVNSAGAEGGPRIAG